MRQLTIRHVGIGALYLLGTMAVFLALVGCVAMVNAVITP